ncbi:hippocampus abundant transcript 1 protein-like isoform X1 [Sesamum indicum]|uniref:Hippocampus abundant transcript 1 protein-like isoform X1 n=1 Tax=Sesamum indicum TaxID=4182 RepID=A0A6I9TSD6_SESIN|nr:hippocampus abundant transcript 1 protein-like isoform X1 [Sesamum indicum]
MENRGRLTHLFVTVFLSNFSELMVSPAIPDVTLSAVCPGKDECSPAIYLTGFQQAIAGIGSVIMMPLIGNLSDAYGRKNMMAIPLLLSIIPLVVLAWKRTLTFFYAYYAIKTFTAMVTQGGVACLALAYLADNVSEGKRISAFGVLSGVTSAAYVGGTLAARLLSTAQIFQVAAILSMVAAIYMGVFLKETTRGDDVLEQPILKVTEGDEDSCKASKKIEVIRKIPSPRDIYRLLKSSITFSLAACVTFFNSLAEAGLQSCLLYFLKARFQFKKDQFADVLLIAYIGATISNMLLMPTLGPIIGEETLLSLGLFAGFLNMFFDSIAWAPWVPYASASMGVFLFLSSPNLRSIVSKQVGPNEQGLAQGCILGMTAFANVISPLIYSPLSALFLSEDAPFHFQGFSILCVGLAWLAGFFLSIMIPLLSRNKSSNGDSVVEA